jgi:hypothetical protein
MCSARPCALSIDLVRSFSITYNHLVEYFKYIVLASGLKTLLNSSAARPKCHTDTSMHHLETPIHRRLAGLIVSTVLITVSALAQDAQAPDGVVFRVTNVGDRAGTETAQV